MRSWRRLFESLEQRIRSLIVHVFGVFDDENARRAFERTKVRLAFKFAHRFHANDLLVRPNHRNICVLAPDHSFPVIGRLSKWREGRSRDSFARRTLVTPFDADSVTTVQSLRHFQRKQLLSNSFFAGEEKRSGHTSAVQQVQQPCLNFFVADECGEHD